MGGCFSKKKKKKEEEASYLNVKPKLKGDDDSRDPPPTESPQEEKVKEVLSETPKLVRSNTSTGTSTRSSKVQSERIKDKCDAERCDEAVDTASESTTTTFTEKAKAEVEGEEVEMKKKMRWTSPAKAQKVMNRPDFRASGKRGVDVGCRSASSPLKARESAATRNRLLSSSTTTSNSNYKREEDVVGERSGRRRSLSPATAIKRSPASTTAMIDQRQCRLAARMNGRCSPQRQRVPARVVEVEGGGQDGNNVNGGSNSMGMSMEAEESLENPLVSLECFIFL